MSVFRKIFGSDSDKSKSELEKKEQRRFLPDEDSPIDEKFTINFNNNGGKFLYSETNDEVQSNLKKIIKENILKVMPDLIITHSQHDYHADHRSLSILASSAVSHYIPILYCDTLMGVNFQPNYYIDITDHFEMKKEAVLKHNSQNPERFVDLFKLMNAYRAAQCNAPKGKYAEAYSFIPSFPFSDIREILPPSLKLRPFYIDKQNGFL